MRYILGISIYNKEKKTTKEGYAVLNSLGLFPSLESISDIEKTLDEDKEVCTKIYNSLEDIQKEISDFSVRFRRDDVWGKHQIWKKSRAIIRFYPIKVDSSKFPFKISKLTPTGKLKSKVKDNIIRLERR